MEGQIHTGGDVVSGERVVLRRSLGQILTPLDSERLAQTLCIEEWNENLVTGFGGCHGCWSVLVAGQ